VLERVQAELHLKTAKASYRAEWDGWERPGVLLARRTRTIKQVLKLVAKGQSYREIGHRLGLSKTTILGIVTRDRAA